MLFNHRFWVPVLTAGFLFYSAQARAGAAEDYDLGMKYYQQGDMVGAMTELRKAVGAGHLKAMTLLAEILDSSEFNEEAIELYRKAADLGDLDGMLGLGAMMAAGEGLKEKNIEEGRRWIMKAAEQGHEAAINVIADAYLKGQLGFTEADRNTPAALEWVKRAAKNNYLQAVLALARAYGTGGMLGVSADAGLAEEYTAQANKIRGIDTAKGKKKAKKTVAAQ